MKPSTKLQKLLPVSSLGFSLILHLAIFLSISGIILIQTVPPKIIPRPFDDTTIPTTTPPTPPPIVPNEPEFPGTENPTPNEPPPTQPIPTLPPSATNNNPLIPSGRDITVPNGGGGSPSSPPPQTGSQTTTNTNKPIVIPAHIIGDINASGGITGRMYDLKQTPDHKKSDLAGIGSGNWGAPEEKKANDGAVQLLTKFISGNWNTSILEKYYCFENEIHSYQIFIPPLSDVEGPKAFGAEKKIQPRRWVIHYTGKFTSPVSGSYRFVGTGDDYLVVRLSNKTVLDGSLHRLTQNNDIRELITTAKGIKAEQTLYGGSWFNLVAGQTYSIEALVGELPGGVMYSFLMMQKKGEKYDLRQNNKDLGPILPVIQFVPTKLPKYQPETNGPTVAKEFFRFQ